MTREADERAISKGKDRTATAKRTLEGNDAHDGECDGDLGAAKMMLINTDSRSNKYITLFMKHIGDSVRTESAVEEIVRIVGGRIISRINRYRNAVEIEAAFAVAVREVSRGAAGAKYQRGEYERLVSQYQRTKERVVTIRNGVCPSAIYSIEMELSNLRNYESKLARINSDERVMFAVSGKYEQLKDL
jgi:hypothetical protein